MKLLKSLFLTCLFVLSFLLSKTSLAQLIPIPTTYTNVSNGYQNLTNVSLSDTVNWFKWSTDSTQVSIEIKMLTNNGKKSIKGAKLYIGRAGSLMQMLDDSYLNLNDSTINIYERFLAVNSNLYLNITTHETCTGCLNTPPTARIIFAPMTINCSPYTQPNCELVKDGGMEGFSSCANVKVIGTYNILPTCFWELPNAQTYPGTSDYFNTCGLLNIPGTTGSENSTNANQNFASMCVAGLAPHSGNGYLGAFLYNSSVSPSNNEYREYIVNKLNSPMIAGKTYSISMYVRLSHASQFAISNISMLLTNTVPLQNFIGSGTNIIPTNIPFNSGEFIQTFNGNAAVTDKTNWTLLTKVYTPTTTCNYITIGNFMPSSATNLTNLHQTGWSYTGTSGNNLGANCNDHEDMAYYYFDDVSIKSFELNAGPDVSICSGQSTTLTSTVICLPSGANITYTWSPSSTLTTPNSYSASASPTVTTNYTLTATITFTNGTAPITLKDYVTVTVTNAGSFTLTANANPNPICLSPGATSTLTTNGGSNLSYTWTNGVNTYTVPSPVISPTNTTTYTVTTTNCGQTYTAAVTITVNVAPPITATPNPVCEGSAVTINTSSLTTISYFNFNEPGSTSNFINPHTYSSAGTYSINVSAYYTAGNCVTNTVIPVLVTSPQTLGLTYSVAPCSNTYTFNANLGCVSNAYDYIFMIDNSGGNVYTSPTSTANICPYNFTTAGIYTISVISTFDNYSSIATVTINVQPVSTPTINIAATSSTICLGNSTTLTASGASTYTWSTGATTSSISVSPTVNTTYTITGTNTSGCSSTKTISINVVPNLTLTATASPTAICAGGSSTLSASGATSYTWSPGALTGASVVVTPTVTTTYTLTGSNGACTNTKTLTVVVNPKPTVTITASSSTVCAGSTVTLTATSGLNSYTWLPCSAACNTNTLVYTAIAGSNTYTVNVTGTNGCTNTAVKTVTAVANPTVSVNSASLCSGNSATLTANGASTYSWNPGALTGSVVVVNPTVTTSYTVVGTNTNGCTNTAISTVTVSVTPPAPFSIFTNVPSPVVANPTGTNTIILSTSITNTTGLIFTWSPSGATTPTTNFNLTQSEIITLEVYNSICPGITTQSICVNYVSASCAGTFPTLNNATLTGTATLGATTATYNVTGTLTINWSSSTNALENKTFIMASGSKVEITPTTAVTLNNIKFFSCNDMWRGIEIKTHVTNAARVIISGDNNSIEDAYMGIYCINPNGVNLNPTISCDLGVLFNKNYYDVYIENTKNVGIAYPFYFRNSKMQSEATNNSPGGNLKCSSYSTPIVKARGYAGLYAINAGIINFDISANPIDYNQVKNKDYGLYFNNTNANVNNVNFNNAIGITYTPGINFITKPAGVGIYSENSGYLNVKPATTPTVGTTTTFTNLGFGIITNNTYTVDIQNTNHTTAAQSYTQNPAWAFNYKSIIWGGTVVNAGYGLNGVFATNARDVLRINNNTISSNYYPVTANYTLSPSSTNTMSVAQNTITKGANADTREGVTFNSAISFTPVANNMRIASNTFSNVNVGVKVTSATIGLRVSTNTITLNTAIADAIGVYVSGSNTVTVDNNDIKGNLTSTNVATWNPRNVGILCVNSPGCKIKCNTVTTTGHGIEFRGVNTSSGDGFFGNILKYPIRRGFVLMNGGMIGTQGNSSGASANQWIAGTSAWPTPATADPNKTSVGGTLTGGSASDAANSPLWVHTGNELPDDNYFTTPSNINNAYALNVTLFTTTAGNYATCPTTLSSLKVAQSGNNSSVERDADFVNYINTILPSSNIDVTPQDKYMLKQYMFDDLTQNPSTNSTLINFVNQQQNLSVDVYHDIDSLLANGNVSAASTKNANASQSNDITQTQNAYNALYMNGINSKADLDNLSAIADLCPQLYGNAVYQARALLQSITYVGKVYTDSCDNSKVRKEMWLDDEPTSVSVADGVQAKLYPNPNNGSFTLAYDLKKHNAAEVYVYDVTGKVVFKTNVDNLENLKQINTSNLQSGIYFIQLVHDKNLLWTDKLIISK